jgi:hypothetical protein
MLGRRRRHGIVLVMDDDDHKAKELKDANEPILTEFFGYLAKQKKLSQKSSQELAQAMHFYADEYLIGYYMESLMNGLKHFESFITDWFLRKCMWSDDASVKMNGKAFELLLDFLESKGHEFSGEVQELRADLQHIVKLAALRANAYNDPKIDLEDLFDDFGCWNDELVLNQNLPKTKKTPKARQKASVKKCIITPADLDVHLIVSARAAKFLKLKPPQVVKMSEWDRNWKDPAIHWFMKWRCEDCFGMKGTKERVLMITNDASRYSFLLRVAPGDIGSLESALFSKMTKLLMDQGCATGDLSGLRLQFLSGSAASLTATQNNLIYYLDSLVDHGEFQYLDDLEKWLNEYLTTIEGEYRFVGREMERLLKDAPPFGKPPTNPSNVIPLWN